MKVTKAQLKEIIKEELARIQQEQNYEDHKITT